MALLLALLGGAAGYLLAPRYIRGAQQIPAAIAGAVLGLILGMFFKGIVSLLFWMFVGAVLYLGYQRYKAQRN